MPGGKAEATVDLPLELVERRRARKTDGLTAAAVARRLGISRGAAVVIEQRLKIRPSQLLVYRKLVDTWVGEAI